MRRGSLWSNPAVSPPDVNARLFRVCVNLLNPDGSGVFLCPDVEEDRTPADAPTRRFPAPDDVLTRPLHSAEGTDPGVAGASDGASADAPAVPAAVDFRSRPA